MTKTRVTRKGNVCGDNVKSIRKKMGMAQADLAAALCVDHGYNFVQSDISEIEQNYRGVKDHEIKALAAVLETTADELLA